MPRSGPACPFPCLTSTSCSTVPRACQTSPWPNLLVTAVPGSGCRGRENPQQPLSSEQSLGARPSCPSHQFRLALTPTLRKQLKGHSSPSDPPHTHTDTHTHWMEWEWGWGGTEAGEYPLIHGFAFQLPTVNCNPKILNGKLRK